MNNKKQAKQPLFAEVNLTGDEFRQSPGTHMQRAAIMYSLIGACKVLGKNPEKWLTYVLKNIGKTKKENLHHQQG